MSSTDTTSQHGKRFHFDIMVIGGGASGLQYILELSKINPCCKIALITKRAQNDCNSYLAQGGIAASNLQKKSLDQHLQDTIKAGCGLCNVETAKKIINYGHEGIESLIKSGVEFDTAGHGFDLAKEGGHSTRRIYHTDDMTGKSIMTALTEQVAKLNQVTIFERHIAVNLIVKKNETIGAYILDENSHKIHCFFANATILATGGAGKVFRYTTNLEVATGDGVAMAYRAGTKIINMEFYQFHPTLLYHTKINNFLITEALRGEGAYLRNAGTGERFMQKYAPEQMELATRDIVARANFNEIEISNANFVYLDIRHKSEKFLKNRFPTVFNQLLELGINISKEMIPVVPAAHYLCGGIATAVDGTTDIKRLYAIGETACTGFHGANRLASNSLLENLAMAHYCAQKKHERYCFSNFHRNNRYNKTMGFKKRHRFTARHTNQCPLARFAWRNDVIRRDNQNGSRIKRLTKINNNARCNNRNILLEP